MPGRQQLPCWSIELCPESQRASMLKGEKDNHSSWTDSAITWITRANRLVGFAVFQAYKPTPRGTANCQRVIPEHTSGAIVITDQIRATKYGPRYHEPVALPLHSGTVPFRLQNHFLRKLNHSTNGNCHPLITISWLNIFYARIRCTSPLVVAIPLTFRDDAGGMISNGHARVNIAGIAVHRESNSPVPESSSESTITLLGKPPLTHRFQIIQQLNKLKCLGWCFDRGLSSS